MNKEKPQFAKNINYLRNQQRLTRKQAADRAGIKLSSWNSYEEGRALPGIGKLPGIFEVLEFSDLMALINIDLAKTKGDFLNKHDTLRSLKKFADLMTREMEKILQS